MPIEFEPGWDKVEAKGFEELNTEETITQLFANAKANLLSKDASDGVALASAQSVKKADTVVIVKGLHQETQVSYNKKDAERSSNFHLNIRLPGEKGERHVYVVTMGTGGYRISEIT